MLVSLYRVLCSVLGADDVHVHTHNEVHADVHVDFYVHACCIILFRKIGPTVTRLVRLCQFDQKRLIQLL